MGNYFLLNPSLAQTSVASPSPLINSWTAPTPSQRPRDPPKSAKNVEIENSGMKDSVMVTS